MAGKKFSLSAAALSAFVFLFPYLVSGHTLWINATDHSPAFFEKFGARTKTYIGYGHRYPVDDFLQAANLGEYSLIGPDGRKKGITSVNPSGFLESDISFREPGHYLIAVTTKPGFYTMYREGGTIHHRLGPKTGLEDVVLSNYYEQYAKSLIHVGTAEGDGFRKPIGHRLELIPMENPSKLKGAGGQIMSFRILFNGRPASFCKVYATYNGFSSNDDFACATTANQDGIARIRMSHWGPWLIKANVKVPPPEEMKDKCNEMNYTATLTLAIP